MGNLWSQLIGGVGTFLNALLQGRDQREFVLVDQSELPPSTIDATALNPLAATPAPPMWVQARAQLEALQKADPNFLESAFLAQASKTFGAVLTAEGLMNADAVAGMVTQAFLQKFKQHIDDWRSGGFDRTVSDLVLDAPTTFKVTIGGALQSIMARFTGSAKRFTKDTMTELITEGSAQSETFTEFATFVRPAGSTTPKTGAGGAPIHCPSCGAPADEGALKCAFCGTPLSGTGGTWLLDRMAVSAYT